MRGIATATLSGNLTRDAELRSLRPGSDVARLRVASSARRRTGEEWVEKTNYFTVEVHGAQANLCAQRLAKGSRVVVDGELDWREWTDQQHNRREVVVLRARQILFEAARSAPHTNSEQGAQNGSSDGESAVLRFRRPPRRTCRSDQSRHAASRPSVSGGRDASRPLVGVDFFLRSWSIQHVGYRGHGGERARGASRALRAF
jgi:single-strand DNA-binding protein